MRVIRQLWHELSTDGVSDLAAGLSYRFLLAIFPFVIFLSALGALVADPLGIDNPASTVVDRVAVALPGDARETVVRQLNEVVEERRPGLASVGILGAIWAAASGVGATMRAMNRAYDVEETRPMWKRIGIALGLTVIAGAAVIGAVVLAIAGDALGAAVAELLGAQGVYSVAVTVVRLIGAIILMVIASAFLFWAAPNARLPFRWLSPGAVVFIGTWLLTTVGFGWYVSNFGSYNATYGALGGLIVAMLWFYLTAFMLLTGAELNAVLARTQDPAAARALEPADPELRQARVESRESAPSAQPDPRAGAHG